MCLGVCVCVSSLKKNKKGVVGRSCERMKQEYEAFGVLEEWERVPFLLLLLLLVAFACLHETKNEREMRFPGCTQLGLKMGAFLQCSEPPAGRIRLEERACFPASRKRTCAGTQISIRFVISCMLSGRHYNLSTGSITISKRGKWSVLCVLVRFAALRLWVRNV